MKLHAYFLAATPQWSQASVSAYYPFVEKIFVTYDEDSLGWGGKPIDVESTLRLLREIDTESKMVFCPGSFHDESITPRKNENKQRSEMVARCAEAGADWILQLDADEIITRPQTFLQCLNKADQGGFKAMDYPSRFLYQYIGNNRFLEERRRFWRPSAGYPGPLAVRPDCVLVDARQTNDPTYRVDFAPRNTDQYRTPDAPVHQVISLDEAVIHYAWVRSKSLLQEKFNNHPDIQGNNEYLQYLIWAWTGKHPYLAMARSPFVRRRTGKRHLKLVSIPAANRYVEEELENILNN